MKHPKSFAGRFSSGQELANYVVNSDLLHHSWAAICELYRETNQNDPNSFLFAIKCKIYQQPPIGTVIAFVSSPTFTSQFLQGERDLVSSATLIRENFPLFDFVTTKVNPSFSLHKAAVTLFASIINRLSVLKDQLPKDQRGNIIPLIVTGHSVGGSVASLFTLWLLDSVFPTARHPLCITFGSPLVGDSGFQQAISERPMWNSCFLHVASNQDPIPKLFASPQNVLSSIYKPFGTFLLCSESGYGCFEEPESILDLMVGNQGPNGGLQFINYGDILENLKRGAVYRGNSEIGEWYVSPLRLGLIIQMEAIKVDRTLQGLINCDINSLVTKIEKGVEDLLASRRNVFEPNKKLNEMKINMTFLEWFKKVSESRGGYYDVFKKEQSKRKEEIVKRKSILTQYWKKMVKEVEKMPQKEGVHLRTTWLYSATNCRRMVEPLDIAEWYKKGNRDYLAGRSEHYKRLEQWMNDKQAGNQTNANERNRACSLTEDSCFWAHVEEAIISCRLLEDGNTCPEDKESSRENLVRFEYYAMELITNYAVSTEVFLKESSFMQWWANYEKIKGTLYHSSLTDYMRNRKYEQYA